MLKDYMTRKIPFFQPSSKRNQTREKPWETDKETVDGEDSAAFSPPAASVPAKPEDAPSLSPPESSETIPGEQDYDAGLRAYAARQYQQSLEAFCRAGETGHIKAQFLCGQMYRQGIGTEQSDKRALTWYKRAAKQGHLDSQLLCAAMCEEGRGTDVHLKRALQWYEQAARQGSVDAQLKCGWMYFQGRAETRNPKKARYWLEAAAAGGNQEARKLLEERF